MELGNWLLYTAAAVGLSLTPGPNGLLALTHGALPNDGVAVDLTGGFFDGARQRDCDANRGAFEKG